MYYIPTVLRSIRSSGILRFIQINFINLMNQVTISPNNKDTLLLVAVPKDARNIHVINFTHGPSTLKWLNYPDKGIVPDSITCIDLEHAHYEVLYLASKISEEQAKELVATQLTWGGYQYKGDFGPYEYAKEALRAIIFYSNLTITEDQDCLILKINWYGDAKI